MSSIAKIHDTFSSLHSSIFHIIFFNSNSLFFDSANGVDCPSGFDGVHREVVNTQAPSAGPTNQHPTQIENSTTTALFPDHSTPIY